jgi:hypothetical protein
MILAGWLFIGLLVASGFLSLRDWFRSKRCQKHGGFGRCRRCDEDAALKSRAEAEERAEAERKRLDITKIFQNMDEKLRAELTAIVMERRAPAPLSRFRRFGGSGRKAVQEASTPKRVTPGLLNTRISEEASGPPNIPTSMYADRLEVNHN